MNRSSLPSSHPAAHPDALQARFAYRITSQLTEQTSALPLDIGERLRVAREQALQRGRAARRAPAVSQGVAGFGSVLTWFGGGDRNAPGWWLKLASVLPLIALVTGLIAIQDWHGNNEISAAAEIDASLLADDLPPSAYSDAGFVEFLKSPRE
jgi:hypothetical protein